MIKLSIKIALVIVILMLAGCATCIISQEGGKWCKHELKALPSDFPSELFKKWFSCEIRGGCIALDERGQCTIVTMIHICRVDDEINEIGSAFARIRDGRMVVWSFVEIVDKKIVVLWRGADITQDESDFLEWFVEQYNSGEENRF